jgi:hypothetical protein
MSKSKFRVDGRMDGANGATVTIDRGVGLFSVRPLRRKREYTLPLKDVAEMVLWRIVKAEANEKLKLKKLRRRGF